MYKIEVLNQRVKDEIFCKEGENLYDALNRSKYPILAPCHGNKTCGKCKVRIVRPECGTVLACDYYPKENIRIELEDSIREKASVLAEFRLPKAKDTGSVCRADQTEEYHVAIDLGTTTIAIALVQGEKIIAIHRGLNPQRRYGFDVLSRITAANHGKSKELQEIICSYLKENIERIVQNCEQNDIRIQSIGIAGNTTMLHLLRGYSVQKLGSYPFQTVTLQEESLSYEELFGRSTENLQVFEQTQVILLPGISAFVGADITAGLYALDFYQNEKINFLIDFGTNGEMVIGNKERLLSTATAAGPAFEGGNITYGTGSIPGAIDSVEIKKRYVKYNTIDNKPPVGICGTGVIELIAELLQMDYMDETGCLADKYRNEGFLVTNQAQNADGKITFSQKDVREFQLAKSAIRTGIEILFMEYGVSIDEIDQVYIAGGMGFHLEIQKAIKIGLLSEQLKNKIVVVGNSCLAGVIKYMNQPSKDRGIEELVDKASYITLGNHEKFQELFLKYMDF